MIAKAPIRNIAAPDTLFIHQSCLSLNFLRKAYTNVVSIYHQSPAPIKTPLVVTNERIQLILSVTTPIDANKAMNRKIARGLVIVTANTER